MKSNASGRLKLRIFDDPVAQSHTPTHLAPDAARFEAHVSKCLFCSAALAVAVGAVADEVAKAIHGLCPAGLALFRSTLPPRAQLGAAVVVARSVRGSQSGVNS